MANDDVGYQAFLIMQSCDQVQDQLILDVILPAGQAPLQRGHQLDARLVARVDRLDGLGQIGRNRLLAEDVLARRCARLNLIGVEL